MDKKLLSTRWVFTRKSEPDGSTRHKARLVARGNHQRAGVDFGDVYAPVVNGRRCALCWLSLLSMTGTLKIVRIPYPGTPSLDT